jgi:hypothetical protein
VFLVNPARTTPKSPATHPLKRELTVPYLDSYGVNPYANEGYAQVENSLGQLDAFTRVSDFSFWTYTLS